MSSAAPASTLFLFEDGQPLTADIVRLNYLEPALAQPAVGSGPPDRYPDLERSIAAPERDGLGIRIPANWGGELVITGDHPVITGTFRLDPLNIPRVTLLGTQEATFQSFIGDFSPGDEGILGELVAQIYRHCQRDEAHPRIPLNPPAGTNYVLFIYPPTPVDPYDLDPDRRNVDRPTTGTLRLAPDEAMLSINLVHSGGFPLRVAWQDADQVLWGDQVPGLPNPPPSERFLSLLPPIDRFTPPRSLRRRACRSTPVSAAESVRRRSSRTSALPTCPSASSTSRCKRRLLGRESPCSPCACPMMRGSPPFAPPAPRRRPRC